MMDRKSLTTAMFLILTMNIGGHTFQCRQTEYQVGNECCSMCLPGQRVRMDCNEFRSTSCLPCTEGTYMDRPTGRKHCFACKICDAGSDLKVKKSCTTTSNTVCEPQEGFYCVDFREGDCAAAKKHKSCRPGQYISQNGTVDRDTECSNCSEGTYSDGTFTSCQPHTQCGSLQLIKAGTVSADAECGKVTLVIIIIVVVICVLLIIAAVVLCRLKKKKKPLNTETNGRNPEQDPLRETSKNNVHTGSDSSNGNIPTVCPVTKTLDDGTSSLQCTEIEGVLSEFPALN